MKYGLAGASGRMGGEIKKAFAAHDLCYTMNSGGEEMKGRPDVLVDFTLPGAFDQVMAAAERFGCPLVTGVTGYDEEHLDRLRALGGAVAVVQSYNFAEGITLLKMILRDFGALFDDWDAEIEETHHNKKKDVPSGTAVLLREALGRDCPSHSLRIGGVPGDHSVVFGNEGEVITLSHRALSRSVFALGALKAAEFAAGAAPGFYSFEEVLECGRKM